MHLTHELTSLDTLRALIVHMFPQRLTMAMLRYRPADLRALQERLVVLTRSIRDHLLCFSPFVRPPISRTIASGGLVSLVSLVK